MSTVDAAALELASLNLSRHLAAGLTLEQALDQVALAGSSREGLREARLLAQAQQRLQDEANAAVRGD